MNTGSASEDAVARSRRNTLNFYVITICLLVVVCLVQAVLLGFRTEDVYMWETQVAQLQAEVADLKAQLAAGGGQN